MIQPAKGTAIRAGWTRSGEAQQKVATAKGEAEPILVVTHGQAKTNDDALSRSISPIFVRAACQSPNRLLTIRKKGNDR